MYNSVKYSFYYLCHTDAHIHYFFEEFLLRCGEVHKFKECIISASRTKSMKAHFFLINVSVCSKNKNAFFFIRVDLNPAFKIIFININRYY